MICDDQHTRPYVVDSLHVDWGLLKKGLGPFQTLVAQTVRNVPAVWVTQVRSLGWEDPLEKEMATHSNILTWRIPWTEDPGRL